MCSVSSASATKPADIGSKSPAGNTLQRLCDMSGNVWEWYWGDGYGPREQTDPTGPTSGWRRVLRGGSWQGVDRGLRSADWLTFGPDIRNDTFGFRVVRREG